MNANWTRWIHASLLVYVKTELDRLNVPVHFEGETGERLEAELDWVDFRWNGPEAKEVSRSYWEIDVVLNFVITSTTSRTDTYTHKKFVGLVQSILKNSINVYKYGDTDVDDQSLFGCLQLKISNKQTISTNYFGRFADPIDLEQSTVEAEYCLTGKF